MAAPDPRATPAVDALAREVVRRARETGLLAPGERVLVAASGGGDSSALALLLAAAGRHGLPLELVLCHVDHGWRGPVEADADREAVERLAAGLGTPLVVVPAPEVPARGEDAARRWRYRALEHAAREARCAKVATGHHLRDQAETVLLRLWRGSGPRGLAGIPARRPLGERGVEVVRPLLDVHPERLRDLLRRRGVAWREDATNADLARDRARVRDRLVRLERRGGAATRRLADLAARLRTRLARLENRVVDRLRGLFEVPPGAGAVGTPRGALLALPEGAFETALRLLGTQIRADRDGPWLTRRHVRLCLLALRAGGAVDLPRGLAFRVAGRRAWLLRRRGEGAGPPPPLRREDVPRRAFDLVAFLAAAPTHEATLDAEALGPSAEVRLARAGDRFTPYGRGVGGPTDVLRFLARRGVPAWLRRRTLVVVGARGVAWIPGQRIDREHAVTDATATVARLRIGADAGAD